MSENTKEQPSTAATDTPAEAVQQKADEAIKAVSDETATLVQRVADDAKAFVDSHLPALQEKGVEFASNLGTKMTEMFAEAKRFLDTHVSGK
jgi:predicted component of type VI protein secretion system